MATINDYNNITFSGLTYIDALLNKNPAWNLLIPAGNVLYYTFSVTEGIESTQTGQQALSTLQQADARIALAYMAQITGIHFVETTDGTAAQIHFANVDLTDSPTTVGQTYTSHTSSPGTSSTVGTSVLTSFDADAYIYFDNAEGKSYTSDLSPGTKGYELLLHELGHAMGLKHPSSVPSDGSNATVLPATLDNTANTLMSLNRTGGVHTVYGDYDIAALKWLYGGDGLGGALGGNGSGGRYIMGLSTNDALTGTAFNDVLEGGAGNDTLDGGAGTDTAFYNGVRSAYTVSKLADGSLQVSSAAEGSDVLQNIELLRFTDGTYTVAQLLSAVTLPPPPTLTVAESASGFVTSHIVQVSGSAQANATVKVYNGGTLVGATQADANGHWSTGTSSLADGIHYTFSATATDAAGNVSAWSPTVTFDLDATAPAAAGGTFSIANGSNQPIFSGKAEAGSIVHVVNAADNTDIGRATVDSLGSWYWQSTPLPSGAYNIRLVATDAAGNSSTASGPMSFTIANSANVTGTASNDSLKPAGAGGAISGGAGTDVLELSGALANYTVKKTVMGYTVADNVGAGGTVSLVGVERIHFGDNITLGLDTDGVGGQAYRLYQAAFGRIPDAAGLGYWIAQMDKGETLLQTAAEFTHQNEFNTLYGSNSTDAQFVTRLYSNVLHRAPEAAGYDYWMGQLANHLPREQMLVAFSESAENVAQVIGKIQDGFAYTAWQG